ncbi:MAG: hypothetical protein ACLPUO_28085 [Streptosporangiaceae bacterium]|jgi:hypothetical protein
MPQRPGPEIPVPLREVAAELVGNQGWRYSRSDAPGLLYAADRALSAVRIPAAPGPRAVRNWLAQIRQAGGIWPAPPRAGDASPRAGEAPGKQPGKQQQP